MSHRYGDVGHLGRGWPKKPGTLLYFGGAVHEVLSDGVTTRERHRWKPKWQRKGNPRKWMQRAFAPHKKGSLHRYLHVPLGRPIPPARLRAAERRLTRAHARAPLRSPRRRKLLRRLREVRLALTARRIAARRPA